MRRRTLPLLAILVAAAPAALRPASVLAPRAAPEPAHGFDDFGDAKRAAETKLQKALEENPDNPDGWIMLVRSYSVLGKRDKAEGALKSAMQHFDGNDAVLARLRTEAGIADGDN